MNKITFTVIFEVINLVLDDCTIYSFGTFSFIFFYIHISFYNCFSFSFKGQGAADPPQLEETFCPGLGNQSEKGEVARFSVFCLGSRRRRTYNRNAVWVTEAAKSGGLPEEITQSLLVLLLLIPVFLLFCRALRWTPMTQGAALHKSRKYPFLRTILSSSPRFTNR